MKAKHSNGISQTTEYSQEPFRSNDYNFNDLNK